MPPDSGSMEFSVEVTSQGYRSVPRAAALDMPHIQNEELTKEAKNL